MREQVIAVQRRLILDRSCRLFGAAVGGYVLAAIFVTAIGAGLIAAGLNRFEATGIAVVAGILIYVGLVVWVVATRRPLRMVMFVTVAGVIAKLAAGAILGQVSS